MDFFGSPTTGVTCGVAVVGCVATGFVFLTGIVFVSPTMDIIGERGI
jgi:hypothetical protein